MKRVLLFLLLFVTCTTGFAQKANINNFIIKENLLKNSKLAIIAADSLDQPVEQINGIYTFTVSGFTQTLKFNDGVAVMPLQLEKSAFVYIRHTNDAGVHSKLLYVYKKDGNLSPYQINSMWLILLPLIILILAFAFRRFIIIALLILLIFFYFNHANGLGIGTFLETIFDSLKRLF